LRPPHPRHLASIVAHNRGATSRSGVWGSARRSPKAKRFVDLLLRAPLRLCSPSIAAQFVAASTPALSWTSEFTSGAELRSCRRSASSSGVLGAGRGALADVRTDTILTASLSSLRSVNRGPHPREAIHLMLRLSLADEKKFDRFDSPRAAGFFDRIIASARRPR
jgi:hypothetical protein